MKVALEEHFILPALLEYLAKGMPRVSRVSYDRLIEKLSDFGEERLAAMDGAGVSVAVLSLSGPGVQAERWAPTMSCSRSIILTRTPSRRGAFSTRRRSTTGLSKDRERQRGEPHAAQAKLYQRPL
jgi:hypothetical protein